MKQIAKDTPVHSIKDMLKVVLEIIKQVNDKKKST